MESTGALNEDFNLSTAESTTVLELAEMIWRKCHGDDRPFAVVSDEPVRARRAEAGPGRQQGPRASWASRPRPPSTTMLDVVIPWMRKAMADGII